MAPSHPFAFDAQNSRRLVILLIGLAVIVGAFATPWWTRGITFNHDCTYTNPAASSASDCAGASTSYTINGQRFTVPGGQAYSPVYTGEGQYLNYRPFATPSVGTFSVDASRDTAVAILGIGAVLATLLMGASTAIRWLADTGRITCNPNLAVRLAIGGFGVGLFTVLWGAFFLPLLGNGPGMLYGDNIKGGLPDQFAPFFTDSRYANAGFFLGIIGFVFLPAYLWADAHAARNAQTWTVGNTKVNIGTLGGTTLQ